MTQSHTILSRLQPFLAAAIFTFYTGYSQSSLKMADSVRTTYNIPELAVGVASADTVFITYVAGVQRTNTSLQAKPGDQFHIGSNTKAITAFIAAWLVQQEKIAWQTSFFQLFPELKTKSRKVYGSITLEMLLNFRSRLPAYTYTNEHPSQQEIQGTLAQQHYQLAQWLLKRKPMKFRHGLTPSNAGYILAGMMLEKAAGCSYQELINQFNRAAGFSFGLGYPNLTDSLQPWGHDAALVPMPPKKIEKLNWLQAAGNLHTDLPNYLSFLQLYLRGLRGDSAFLSATALQHLLFGQRAFAFGWFQQEDPVTHHPQAFNEGDAGAFTSRVLIDRGAGLAFVLLTNASTPATRSGLTELERYLLERYVMGKGW